MTLALAQTADSLSSPRPDAARADLIVVSSSFLTDRVFAHTAFLKELSRELSVELWAASAANPAFDEMWDRAPASVQPLPAIRPFREFPHNMLRRLNEYAWDFRHRPPGRLSAMRNGRHASRSWFIRSLKAPARLIAALGAEDIVEHQIQRLLLSYPRSPEATLRLRESRPAALMTTGPLQFEQPAIETAASLLGIPTLALIPSWDNVSTKNRMVSRHDGYLVWTSHIERQLREFYPHSRRVPIYVVGAAQFDVFFQDRYRLTRAGFCAAQGLRRDLPILVYALGSPNVLREEHGALELAERIARDALGDVQLLVRPHPLFDAAELGSAFERFGPRVVVQKTSRGEVPLGRSQDTNQIVEWVNTFRHAAVVINLSSTVAIDAAIFDRPIVNLDYDPEPGRPNQGLVKDVNHEWTPFKPIAESGGVWLVNDPDELVAAVKTYLAHPELHRAERRWIAEYVCGYLDGRCGRRMAEAVLEFVARQRI